MSRWDDFEAKVGPTIVDALAGTAPVDTGQLAESHSWRDQGEHRLEAISTDDRGPIALFVIGGTAPHPIDPVNAKMLHWIGPDGDVFAMHVDHPGTQPNPYNQDAWESVRDEVVTNFKQIVGVGAALALVNPWRNRSLGDGSAAPGDTVDALDGG